LASDKHKLTALGALVAAGVATADGGRKRRLRRPPESETKRPPEGGLTVQPVQGSGVWDQPARGSEF
jgi:hypothetical protein